jgi:hypothetical protein
MTAGSGSRPTCWRAGWDWGHLGLSAGWGQSFALVEIQSCALWLRTGRAVAEPAPAAAFSVTELPQKRLFLAWNSKLDSHTHLAGTKLSIPGAGKILAFVPF